MEASLSWKDHHASIAKGLDVLTENPLEFDLDQRRLRGHLRPCIRSHFPCSLGGHLSGREPRLLLCQLLLFGRAGRLLRHVRCPLRGGHPRFLFFRSFGGLAGMRPAGRAALRLAL